MQDPEQIRRFTRGVATLKDAPWLPIALWLGLVPWLVQNGLIHPAWLLSFPVAALATAIAVRWFKRTYGVVMPRPDSFPGRMKAGGAVLLVLAVWASEALVAALQIPVRLGMILFGAWLIWGGHRSDGLRSHLYVLGAICVGLAFLPLIAEGTTVRQGSIFIAVFGLGWAYVCIQDYRMLRRVRSVRL